MNNKDRILQAVLVFACLLVIVHASQAQWNVGTRADVEVAGRQGWILIPEDPLPGNPWVWRARFPNWHTDMDSILFVSGFHIAYINTDNLYGSPAAMDIWDQFYTYLREQYHVSERVALEGVSRGGLFVYNWAKRNPDKVACIYAEAPVCDIKSWPMGQGKYRGSAQDVERMLQAYGFNDRAEALAYRDNPIDGLETLAAHKVPILHLIGLNDIIVPPEENTFVLVDRYIRAGGIATVYPNTRGEEKLEGHHFEIDDPGFIADFIYRHSVSRTGALSSSNYHQLRNGCAQAFRKFRQSGKGTVAFLGGSITYNPGWRDSVCQYLELQYPDTEFTFIGAGIPSMGSTPGAFRLQRDVLSKGVVDLLFVESAVNDRANGRSTREIIRGVEGIFRHAMSSNPEMDLVIMYFVDPDKMEDYNNGLVPEEIQTYELLATHYGVGSINLAKEVTDRIGAGEFSWEEDFKDLHPSPFGQAVYFRSMRVFLDAAMQKAQMQQVVKTVLPEAVDPFNYSGGKLVDIRRANAKKGWNILASWHPSDSASTRKGFVDVPMLVGEQPGAALKFTFSGSAAGIVVAAGPDAGQIRYRVDRGSWHEQDLYTRWSRRLHLPCYYVLAGTLDAKEQHLLEIEIMERKAGEPGGNACRIGSFFVNE